MHCLQEMVNHAMLIELYFNRTLKNNSICSFCVQKESEKLNNENLHTVMCLNFTLYSIWLEGLCPLSFLR